MLEQIRVQGDLEGITILLVEDTCETQQLHCHFLSRVGARVTCVNNGKDAVIEARDRAFDVILMDIQMPIMNGFDATTTLRSNGYGHPILALTSLVLDDDNDTKDVRDLCLAAGCNAYLSKPVSKSLLVATIQNLLITVK